MAILKREKKASAAMIKTMALEYLDVLYATALRLMRNPSDAEDLIQDTYLRAVHFAHRFEPGSNLRAWMFKIMYNLFLNHCRSNRKLRELKDGEHQIELEDRLYSKESSKQAAVPEECFFEHMFSDDVIRAVDGLPLDYKLAVLLADINEFSYTQIADILQVPVGTVMSRLHRGRQMLKAALYSFALDRGYVKSEPEQDLEPDKVVLFDEKKRLCKKN